MRTVLSILLLLSSVCLGTCLALQIGGLSMTFAGICILTYITNVAHDYYGE